MELPAKSFEKFDLRMSSQVWNLAHTFFKGDL